MEYNKCKLYSKEASLMRNLTMLTDLYQLTMMYGYFKSGMTQNEGVFDIFFRPRNNITYTVTAGLESVINYINDLHFSQEDIAVSRSACGAALHGRHLCHAGGNGRLSV